MGVPQDGLRLIGKIAKCLAKQGDGERWHKKLSACIQEGLPVPVSAPPPLSHSVLCLLTPALVIPVTDGTKTLAQATDVFPGGIYGESCGGSSQAQPKTLVNVHELIENATFQQMFEGQGVDLDKICLEQDQIVEFVISHPDQLHPQGYATFFLFRANGDFFVAHVYWCDARRLLVRVRHLAYAYVWFAGYCYRVVLPQLAL